MIPLLVICLCGTINCVEEGSPLPFAITDVSPQPLSPTRSVSVRGRGFGEITGNVTINDRPLTIVRWSDRLLEAELPADVSRGARFLVVSRSGQQSAPFPVTVEGDPGERTRGTLDFAQISDMGSPRDQAVDQAIEPDQTVGGRVNVVLDDEEAIVTFEAELRDAFVERELWVKVIAHDPIQRDQEEGWATNPLWGAAAQLDYPVDRLELVGIAEENAPERAALTGNQAGRIYWYHGDLRIPSSATRFTLITLRFKLINDEDSAPIRLSFPTRFTSLRGMSNQRLPGAWSGGTLTFEGMGGLP